MARPKKAEKEAEQPEPVAKAQARAAPTEIVARRMPAQSSKRDFLLGLHPVSNGRFAAALHIRGPGEEEIIEWLSPLVRGELGESQHVATQRLVGALKRECLRPRSRTFRPDGAPWSA